MQSGVTSSLKQTEDQQAEVRVPVLPPHSADVPLQLLDLVRAWSERRDNDNHIFDVLSLAAIV